MDSMPLAEKYTLLLQSYSTSILERRLQADKRIDLFQNMESLYNEMIQQSIAPEPMAAQAMIDASSKFGNVAVMSKAARLIRAGGSMRSFGVGVGQISSPTLSGGWSSGSIPTDDRRSEVFCAAVVSSLSLLWLSMQAVDVVNHEIHPWLTLYNVFLLAVGAAEVTLRQGSSIRKAAAGLERLLLSDEERVAHCDGSALLVGYLLGLPCFCYRPDVVEAVKLLKESPDSLDAFKQPAAATASARRRSATTSGSSFMKMIRGDKSESSLSMVQRVDLDADLSIYTDMDDDEGERSPSRLLRVGRLLIWLIAPVAAETMKYGTTIVSDPERCKRLLGILKGLKSSDSSKEYVLPDTER